MYLDFNSAEELIAAIAGMPRATADVAMIYLSDKHEQQVGAMIAGLDAQGIRFFGGIFPGLIDRDRPVYSGAVVNFVESATAPVMVQLGFDGLAQPDLLPQLVARQDRRSCFVLVDCFAPGITQFLDQLHRRYGGSVEFFGAGAGNRELAHRPSVFSNDGVFANAAVVAFSEQRNDVSVRHGWQHYAGPYIVTRSERNVIHELNGHPALETYSAALPERLRGVRADRFYAEVGSRYPLSIQQEGAEDVVRDPVAFTPDGSLIVLSDIPQDSVMHMVHAGPEWLIRAAAKAVGELDGESACNRLLVADCYSRTLMMGTDFCRELATAERKARENVPATAMEGLLALGEIAGSAGRSLEFFNKTFVACRMN
ncbi:MAG: FIST signal transduction protein [Thiotrichales bacterium]